MGSRELALERDFHKCTVCGKTHHEIMLDVHHKDRIKSNNELENLVTLCHSCHTKEHKEENITVRWADPKQKENIKRDKEGKFCKH